MKYLALLEDIFSIPLFIGMVIIFALVLAWGVALAKTAKIDNAVKQKEAIKKCVVADVVAYLGLWAITIFIGNIYQLKYDGFVFPTLPYVLAYLAILWITTYVIYKKMKANIFIWHLILMLPGMFIYLGLLFIGVGLSGAAGIG